jgi:hypothetical protein
MEVEFPIVAVFNEPTLLESSRVYRVSRCYKDPLAFFLFVAFLFHLPPSSPPSLTKS